jgi:hypothetical protein
VHACGPVVCKTAASLICGTDRPSQAQPNVQNGARFVAGAISRVTVLANLTDPFTKPFLEQIEGAGSGWASPLVRTVNRPRR